MVSNKEEIGEMLCNGHLEPVAAMSSDRGHMCCADVLVDVDDKDVFVNSDACMTTHAVRQQRYLPHAERTVLQSHTLLLLQSIMCLIFAVDHNLWLYMLL